MKENNKIRSFICIHFPDEVIKEIARIQELINNKVKFTGKLTELENLHLTLKFLGEIEEERLTQVKEKLQSIKFASFTAKLLNMGIFSYKKNPKVIWIKVGGKELFELQKQIDNALKELFKPEERFMSHLTIARIKHMKDKTAFKQYLKNISVKPIKFQVSSFELKSSELRPLGPVYNTIEEYNSKKEINK